VIEAEWETQPPPAAFTLFGIPNDEKERTDYALRIPYVLGLIATRSVDEKVIGIKELKAQHLKRIDSGIIAYEALQKLRGGGKNQEVLETFAKHKADLGYALLLKKYTPNVVDATLEQKVRAANDTIPKVWPVFWSFRIMVGLGILFLFIFSCAFYFCARRDVHHQTWLLKLALYSIPLPWIAAELGWIVAEYGRQPWAISGVLPTFLGTSNIEAGKIYISLAGFIFFYTFLLIVELYLMFKYARLGPSSLHTGHYHFEAAHA